MGLDRQVAIPVDGWCEMKADAEEAVARIVTRRVERVIVDLIMPVEVEVPMYEAQES